MIYETARIVKSDHVDRRMQEVINRFRIDHFRIVAFERFKVTLNFKRGVLQ